MDEFRPLFTSLYCGFIYKQGTIRCGIFRKIETKRQCCLLWCFICKNLDNIISRPQRTVQNNKKTKAVHDPFKHQFCSPKSFRLSQKILLLVLLSWAWLEHGLEWPCQLSQTQNVSLLSLTMFSSMASVLRLLCLVSLEFDQSEICGAGLGSGKTLVVLVTLTLYNTLHY